jgi:hypothetical protein
MYFFHSFKEVIRAPDWIRTQSFEDQEMVWRFGGGQDFPQI